VRRFDEDSPVLSVNCQLLFKLDGTYKGRLALRKGEGRVRVTHSALCRLEGFEPLTLILSPWPRGEAKQTRWD
jgi:hypothetical protein